MVKLDVSDFFGKLDPRSFYEWIIAVEDYFDWYGMSEDEEVRFIKMKLKGQACMWWRGIEDHMIRLGQPPIVPWEEVKLKLYERYLPLDYEDSVFEELLQLKQEAMNVEDYTEKFNNLTVRCQLEENDCQLLSRYKTGVRTDITREMTIRFFSIDEVYQMALKIEEQAKESTHFKRFGCRTGDVAPKSKLPTVNHAVNKENAAKTVSNNSSYKGKNVADSSRNQDRDIECYRCGGRGHVAFMRPAKNLNFCDEEDAEEIFNLQGKERKKVLDEHDENLKEFEGAEQVTMVIRHLLIAPKEESSENCLRTNIFHANVKCGDQVVKLIIDGGSCANVVSQALVDKLKLKS